MRKAERVEGWVARQKRRVGRGSGGEVVFSSLSTPLRFFIFLPPRLPSRFAAPWFSSTFVAHCASPRAHSPRGPRATASWAATRAVAPVVSSIGRRPDRPAPPPARSPRRLPPGARAANTAPAPAAVDWRDRGRGRPARRARGRPPRPKRLCSNRATHRSLLPYSPSSPQDQHVPLQRPAHLPGARHAVRPHRRPGEREERGPASI